MSVGARLAIALLGYASILFVPSWPALAANVLGWRLNSDNLVFMSAFGLESRTHTSFHDSADFNVQPTDLVYQHSHDNVTEVTVYDGPYGDVGYYGRAICNNPQNGLCASVTIQINTAPPDGSYTQLESDSLMCEEVGHAFGLDHKDPNDTDSCMSQNFSLRRWDTHDKSHVNGWY